MATATGAVRQDDETLVAFLYGAPLLLVGLPLVELGALQTTRAVHQGGLHVRADFLAASAALVVTGVAIAPASLPVGGASALLGVGLAVGQVALDAQRAHEVRLFARPDGVGLSMDW